MARTKVKGGKRRILGVLERARAVKAGGLKEECSSMFYGKVAGHRNAGWGCVGHGTEAPLFARALAPERWPREPCWAGEGSCLRGLTLCPA